jgi:hypothetical protein
MSRQDRVKASLWIEIVMEFTVLAMEGDFPVIP